MEYDINVFRYLPAKVCVPDVAADNLKIGSDLGKYTNVIFLRHANDKEATFEDGGYWNTSGDLLFVADKNCFKITSWNYSGVWTNK